LLVTLATLGYGDITPTSPWLQVLAPLEALVGFALLGAIVTWVLSIYQPLSRSQAFAHQITLLQQAERVTGTTVMHLDAEAVEELLRSITAQVITIRIDLIRFPLTYYFHSTDQRCCLPRVMPYVLALAEDGLKGGCPPRVRLQAALLRGAINDFAATLGAAFLDLPSASAGAILKAYARDQLQPVRDTGKAW
jgi:hypothetical protein